VKYIKQEDLTQIKDTDAVLGKLEAVLNDDSDWHLQFNALNDLRSLIKFDKNLFADQRLLFSVFTKVGFEFMVSGWNYDYQSHIWHFEERIDSFE
jgi:hypothetical protein